MVQLSFRWYRFDAREIVRRLLYLGPMVQLQGPKVLQEELAAVLEKHCLKIQKQGEHPMNREDRFYDLMEENTDDASIQYEIGLCYLNGDGTEKDTAEAEKWLTRAANQGHEQAKALLESGNHGTPEEPAETDILELCMKAEDGDKDAQYAAARYFMAHGMAQTEADRYLKAAADQGNGQACDELGESLLQQSINCANQNDRFEKENRQSAISKMRLTAVFRMRQNGWPTAI